MTRPEKSAERGLSTLADLGGLVAALNQHAIVSMADRSGTVVYVNDRFCAISGYSRAELIGQDHRIVNSGHHLADFFGGMWRTIVAGNPWHGEVCNRAKDGALYWVDTSIVPIRDPAGRVDRFVSIRYDITERKRTQELLAEALEAITDGFVIYDPADRLVMCNGAYRKIYAASSSAMKPGATFGEVIRYGLEHGQSPEAGDSPESKAQWFERRMRAHRGGAGEFLHRLPGGNWVQARERRTPSGYTVGIRSDVTAIKEAEEGLRSSQAKLKGLFELSPVGIALNDFETGGFIDCNEAFLRATGFGRDELLGVSAAALSPPGCWWQTGKMLDELRQAGRCGPIETEQARKDKTRFPVLLSGMRMTDPAGREIIWSIIQDISPRKAMEHELAIAARTDRLTGLANRSVLLEGLEHSLRVMRDDPRRTSAVLFLDFDRFKRVNDSLGHEAGDRLLQQIAERLRKTLRASDFMRGSAEGNIVARFGGDEFAVLLRDFAGPQDVLAVSERVLRALEPVYVLDNHEIRSSASIGIVICDAMSESAGAVLRDADTAMYEAKRSGRGRATLFDERMHERASRYLLIDQGLYKAIGTSQFTLAYQPIVDLKRCEVVGVEAFLRWRHPTHGSIEPAEFIPVAEESGLMADIGEWVLREACRQFVAWNREAPEFAPKSVNVNLSRVQMGSPARLLSSLRWIVAETGIDPRCLQLELSEHEVMRDRTASGALINRLRSIGVRLAMDDFGTASASLEILRDLPLDAIKIDQSLVSGLEASSEVMTLIRTAVALAGRLGVVSVAEGVESPAELAVLRSVGCLHAQGFLFSHPLDPEALLKYAVSRREGHHAGLPLVE